MTEGDEERMLGVGNERERGTEGEGGVRKERTKGEEVIQEDVRR